MLGYCHGPALHWSGQVSGQPSPDLRVPSSFSEYMTLGESRAWRDLLVLSPATSPGFVLGATLSTAGHPCTSGESVLPSQN